MKSLSEKPPNAGDTHLEASCPFWDSGLQRDEMSLLGLSHSACKNKYS